jgi:hypothetical protein
MQRRVVPSELNSISDVTSQSPEEILRYFLRNNKPVMIVIYGLSACLSQMSVRDLLMIVESSKLVSKLKTIDNLIKSGTIDEIVADMSLRQTLQEMFSNFSSDAEGEQNLIAVIAMLVLLRIPTNDVTKDEDKIIEDLKRLFISTLFHNDIATQLMLFRDQFQRRRDIHSSVNCNSRFILSIGWYIAAQEAHDKDAFVENSDGGTGYLVL